MCPTCFPHCSCPEAKVRARYTEVFYRAAQDFKDEIRDIKALLRTPTRFEQRILRATEVACAGYAQANGTVEARAQSGFHLRHAGSLHTHCP